MKDQRSVVQVAVDVHSTNIGAYERSEKEQSKDIQRLGSRLARWHTMSSGGDCRFDRTVKELIMAALEESPKPCGICGALLEQIDHPHTCESCGKIICDEHWVIGEDCDLCTKCAGELENKEPHGPRN